MFRVIRLLSRDRWRKSLENEAISVLRHDDVRKNQGARLVLLRLLGAVLCGSLPRSAPAEVLPVLVARGHLRGLLSGANRMRSPESLQPPDSGRDCLCRGTLHHKAREGLRQASESAMIPRSVFPAVPRLSLQGSSNTGEFSRLLPFVSGICCIYIN